MSKITKLLALMLAVVFALSLVACTGDPAPNDETTAPVSQSANVSTEAGETTTTTAGKEDKTTKTKNDDVDL